MSKHIKLLLKTERKREKKREREREREKEREKINFYRKQYLMLKNLLSAAKLL